MTPTQRKAMEQALEAFDGGSWEQLVAAAALRAALAEQPAEPLLTVDALRVEFERSYKGSVGLTRLSRGEYLSPTIETEWQQFVRKYTTPQPAKRVQLTDEEIVRLWYPSAVVSEPGTRRVAFAHAVIEAYEIKNGLKP